LNTKKKDVARVYGEMSEEERAAFKQEIAAIDAESNPAMPPPHT
jgi:hypothetical protein